jgi:hypothetical protein
MFAGGLFSDPSVGAKSRRGKKKIDKRLKDETNDKTINWRKDQ